MIPLRHFTFREAAEHNREVVCSLHDTDNKHA